MTVPEIQRWLIHLNQAERVLAAEVFDVGALKYLPDAQNGKDGIEQGPDAN